MNMYEKTSPKNSPSAHTTCCSRCRRAQDSPTPSKQAGAFSSFSSSDTTLATASPFASHTMEYSSYDTSYAGFCYAAVLVSESTSMLPTATAIASASPAPRVSSPSPFQPASRFGMQTLRGGGTPAPIVTRQAPATRMCCNPHEDIPGARLPPPKT